MATSETTAELGWSAWIVQRWCDATMTPLR